MLPCVLKGPSGVMVHMSHPTMVSDGSGRPVVGVLQSHGSLPPLWPWLHTCKARTTGSLRQAGLAQNWLGPKRKLAKNFLSWHGVGHEHA
jgi:hypothetical protein